MARYRAPQPSPNVGAVIPDTLEAVAREGARRMLERALEAEVDVFLGRLRYAPGGRETGYRNGHGRSREIGIGTWSVEVRPHGSRTCRRGPSPSARHSCPSAAT